MQPLFFMLIMYLYIRQKQQLIIIMSFKFYLSKLWMTVHHIGASIMYHLYNPARMHYLHVHNIILKIIIIHTYICTG